MGLIDLGAELPDSGGDVVDLEGLGEFFDGACSS